MPPSQLFRKATFSVLFLGLEQATAGMVMVPSSAMATSLSSSAISISFDRSIAQDLVRFPEQTTFFGAQGGKFGIRFRLLKVRIFDDCPLQVEGQAVPESTALTVLAKD